MRPDSRFAALASVLVLWTGPRVAEAQSLAGEAVRPPSSWRASLDRGGVTKAARMEVTRQETAASSLRLTGHWAFRWTRLYEDGARLAGGGIGLRLGDRCQVELVGFGTASPSTYSTLEFGVAYGGIRLERELWRSGRFSTSVALFGGGGSFSTKDRQSGDEDRTGVFVVEPEVLQGFDLGGHVRLAITGSYRWVTGIEGDIQNRSDGDARGFAVGGHLSLR